MTQNQSHIELLKDITEELKSMADSQSIQLSGRAPYEIRNKQADTIATLANVLLTIITEHEKSINHLIPQRDYLD